MHNGDEKSLLYNCRTEAVGNMLNFGKVEVLDRKCMENPRKLFETVHIRLRRGSVIKLAGAPIQYYHVLKKKNSYKFRYTH